MSDSRILRINITEDKWNSFLRDTEEFSRKILEKRPYSRFIVASVLQKILGRELIDHIVHTVKSGNSGCVLINCPQQNRDFSGQLKMATAFACSLGKAHFDEMSKNYFAAVSLTPQSQGDSFLTEPYYDLRLHTDGSFYKKAVEWLVLAKTEQADISGGELSLHHLNDLDSLQELLQHPLAFETFNFEASASKMLSESISQPIFFKKNGQIALRFSDQFCQPETMEQALFLHTISEQLEKSPAKIIEPFPEGQILILNNAFWLHGRLKIKEGSEFKRQILRLRGSFF